MMITTLSNACVMHTNFVIIFTCFTRRLIMAVHVFTSAFLNQHSFSIIAKINNIKLEINILCENVGFYTRILRNFN